MTDRPNRRKTALIAVSCILGLLLIAAAGAMAILHIRTAALRDGWQALYENEKYAAPVFVEGVGVIEQDVSCGYAVIEMFSAWNGDDITEESLYGEYGKVVTSTGKAFCGEMNKRFPGYKTEMRSYLTDTELIDTVYDSLSEGIPVPFEWAAQYDSVWTLHYSLIIGADIPGNRITVANPYGYYEELSLEEFLGRTRFDSFENMPLWLRMGFAYGIFEKNTVFVVKRQNI